MAAVDVLIDSQGCEDPTNIRGTSGKSTIFVNGIDKSLHGGGFNIAWVC